MVLKNDVFPVGKPEVIVDPGTTDISQFFGLIKAKVRPPRGLYHPCLPHRVNGKLMFPLCGKCARENRKGKCRCTEEERYLVGEWTTVDLEDAVSIGYQIIHIYEVYHFKERAQYTRGAQESQGSQGAQGALGEANSGLFEEYINLFLKGKRGFGLAFIEYDP